MNIVDMILMNGTKHQRQNPCPSSPTGFCEYSGYYVSLPGATPYCRRTKQFIDLRFKTIKCQISDNSEEEKTE
jgi:hypothetical protein